MPCRKCKEERFSFMGIIHNSYFKLFLSIQFFSAPTIPLKLICFLLPLLTFSCSSEYLLPLHKKSADYIKLRMFFLVIRLGHREFTDLRQNQTLSKVYVQFCKQWVLSAEDWVKGAGELADCCGANPVLSTQSSVLKSSRAVQGLTGPKGPW